MGAVSETGAAGEVVSTRSRPMCMHLRCQTDPPRSIDITQPGGPGLSRPYTISEDESTELFDDIDKDRSGFIEVHELKKVLRLQM